MLIKSESLTFDNFCSIAEAFAPCMNDYLFTYDIQKDTYYVSTQAVNRLQLPAEPAQNLAALMQRYVHPDDLAMLSQDIYQMLRGEKNEHNLEYRLLGPDGFPIWINCRAKLITDENNKPMLIIGCINEIGNTQRADNISGLPGEGFLQEHVDTLLPNLSTGSVLRIGIDDFKAINERYGVTYGNYILRKVAGCIQKNLDNVQYAYRIISDEFIILDTINRPVDALDELYFRIRRAVDELVKAEQYKALYTISCGIVSLASVQVSGYEELLKKAEFALAEAKRRGKNQVYHFEHEDYMQFLRRRHIGTCLLRSTANSFEGFSLNYQPIIKRHGQHLYAAEALLRYQLPEGENVSPGEFIPILEESGLIIPVGKWVIQKALKMCARCRTSCPDFRVSINLSYIQILKSPLYKEIAEALADSNLPPDCLIVELTESGHLEGTPAIQSVWHKLKNEDIGIAVDDFGTGYSNLRNIANLRPNIVKIDRSFTARALQNDYEHQLMTHIIHMVHSLGLNLVVEGVETHEELNKITALQPDFIQGYFYSRPCTEEIFFQKFGIA